METHDQNIKELEISNIILREATAADIESIFMLDEIAKIASTGSGYGNDTESRKHDIETMINMKDYFQLYLVTGNKNESIGCAIISIKPSAQEFTSEDKNPILPENSDKTKIIPYEEFRSILTTKDQPSLARIDSLTISPKFQNKGIGEQVNTQLEYTLREKGFKWLSFNTHVDYLAKSAPKRGFTVYHTGFYGENRKKFTGLKELQIRSIKYQPS